MIGFPRTLRTVIWLWAALATAMALVMISSNMAYLLRGTLLPWMSPFRLVLGSAGLLGGAILLWWTHREVLRPLARMRRAIARARLLRASERLVEEGSAELRELQRLINELWERQDRDATALHQESDRTKVTYRAMLGALEDTVALNRQLSEHRQQLARSFGELERAYQELRDLQEVDRLKNAFLDAISHELRTPLNYIMASASVLEDEVTGPLTEDQHRMAQNVLAGAERLLSHVTNLLDYTRMEAGAFEIRAVATPYEPLLRQVVCELSPLAAEKGLVLELMSGPELTLQADPERVAQILTNLLSNAIKFTPAGGRVWIRTRQEHGWAWTEVEDTGPGIRPADLPRIFTKFFQADGLHTGHGRQTAGTGLGLAITRGLVEAHGGRIEVESPPGRGATFRFSLPLAE